MKNELWFENLTTGELLNGTHAHKYAMEWYRAGAEVALLNHDPETGEWYEMGRWVH